MLEGPYNVLYLLIEMIGIFFTWESFSVSILHRSDPLTSGFPIILLFNDIVVLKE